MNFRENFIADSPFLKHHTKKMKRKRKKENQCGKGGCKIRKDGEVEVEEVEVFEKRGKKKDTCWPGYVAKGKKKSPSGKRTKSGKIKMVNNCVKVKRKRKR